MCEHQEMRVRAVVFDIGGVLEHTPPTGWEHRWASELGLSTEEFGHRLGRLWSPGEIGAQSLEVIEQQTAEAFALDPRQLHHLTDEIWSEYLGSLNHELLAYFKALRPRYRTGILSNSMVGAREREQAAYGFGEICDVIVYSHEEGLAKPDPRFYQLVCDRLGVQPSETVFLDDTPACIEGARTIGMHAVRFVDNKRAIAGLSAMLTR
jgi:epoxide hydrolase-like predicted phosphatase